MQLYRPNIIFFETDQLMYEQAGVFMMDVILDSIGNEGSARIGVSGGSTPLKLYSDLAQNPVIEWDKISFFQLDERLVSSDDAQSNQNSISKAFGEDVIKSLKEFNKIDTDLDKDSSVQKYNEVLETLEEPMFDISILGIGEDGHFASLFPGGDYLGHTTKKVLSTNATDTYETKSRISVSIETVLSSQTLLVLLKGKDKEFVIKNLMESDKRAVDFPAKFLLSHPNLVIYQSMQELEKE